MITFRVCFIVLAFGSSFSYAQNSQSPVSSLSDGTRGWETIPGVVLDNSTEFEEGDSFRLEIDVNGPVRSVGFVGPMPPQLTYSSPDATVFYDDGTHEDRTQWWDSRT